MKKRSKKLLSLFLAAAMVFSMNTAVFGEEKAEVPAVLDTEDGPSLSANVMTWHAYDWDRKTGQNLMAGYFVGLGDITENKTATSDHIVDGTVIPVSATQSDGYNSTDFEGSVYYYGGLADIYNKVEIPEKGKMKIIGYGIDGWDYSVSSNVFELGNDAYLIVAYGFTAQTRGLNHNGSNIPVVMFNGKKYLDVSKAPTNGKMDKNNSYLRVEAAIVTQKAGEAPVLVANSLSKNTAGKKLKDMISIKVNPKNNQYANVSMNYLEDKDGNNIGFPAIENPYLKSGAVPYFTVSIKTDKSLKEYSLKSAKDGAGTDLKKAQFRFDICRNTFAKWTYGTLSAGSIDKDRDHWWDDEEAEGFRHAYPGAADPWGEDNVWNNQGHLIYYRNILTDIIGARVETPLGRLDLITDAKKIGKTVPVYIRMTRGEETEKTTATTYDYSHKYLTYKLTQKKDYNVESLPNGVLLLTPYGNFEGDGATFRNAEVTGYDGKKYSQVRCGIAKLDSSLKPVNYYVDSIGE